ncbi:hypothetical protein WA158_003095 [Blastocystis sp. Blastoise]
MSQPVFNNNNNLEPAPMPSENIEPAPIGVDQSNVQPTAAPEVEPVPAPIAEPAVAPIAPIAPEPVAAPTPEPIPAPVAAPVPAPIPAPVAAPAPAPVPAPADPNGSAPKAVELTGISVNETTQSTSKYCWGPKELGAPQADIKDSLFDWQLENKGAKTLDAFGGVKGLAACFGTNLEKGLTDEEAEDEERAEVYGTNRTVEKKSATYWEIVWDALQDVTLIILIVAAVVSMILGVITEGWGSGWIDGAAILLAVVIVVNVTAINDLQKDKQFRALNAINNRKLINVIRNGIQSQVVVDDLVVGDIVCVGAGDTIPADGIFISGNHVKMDESKLTGESDQVAKSIKNPFIVSSSECHEGSFLMLVVAVGQNSVFGRMRSMIEGEEEENTPLQVKLSILSTQISVLGAVVGVLTVVVMLILHLIEYFNGNGTVDAEGNPAWTTDNWSSLVDYFITGVTILVVAIPEGLPLAVTIALAYSVKRMMKDNNLVRHLAACETMGGANTICSDKTGTLTQGKMTVVQGWSYKEGEETKLLSELKSGSSDEYNAFLEKCKTISKPTFDLLLNDGILNNEGFLTVDEDGREKGVGGALDIALLNWCNRMGFKYSEIRDQYPTLKENCGPNDVGIIKNYPFHSNRKRASVLVRLPNGKYRLYVKGAPEMVIRICDKLTYGEGQIKDLTGDFQEQSGKVLGSGSRKNIVENCIYPMAKQALRVLAFAYRDFDAPEDWDATCVFKTEEQKGVGDCPIIEQHLTLIGLLGFQDPVRPEVPEAVKSCQGAGIFVRMVTGDNMETAKAIAKQCNIYHNEPWKDPRGTMHPAGRAILGSQFREVVGGLVLPPHFYHECKCCDCSNDPLFIKDYETPAYPEHFGYPSMVNHKTHLCNDWTHEAVESRGEGKRACTQECKERGCMYRLKNQKDERELQSYYVVKNQGQFEQFVDTLQVMARSAPTDKHLLVTGLMERGQVVAVTGDGTNDGPALAKSNVGFAMGIAGTSVAKDASDIVLMDDNFTSIVKAVMWGRNVYDSIRKFLQFQLTVNVVALVLAFSSACILKESPLTAVQLLWVNLIMDTFAALALATELPTPKLLDRVPYTKKESLISKLMLRNILGQSFFQLIVLFFLTYEGHVLFNVPIGSRLGYGADNTKHLSMVFNTFVFMQVFNEFNSRKINNEWNIFENIFTSGMFWFVIVITVVLQIVIVEWAGPIMNTTTLTVIQYLISVAIGAVSLVMCQLFRIIPGSWFLDLGSSSSTDAQDNPWTKLRAKNRLSSATLKSVTSTQYEDTAHLKRIFTRS